MYHVLILENDINERQHTYPDVILITANIYSLHGGVESVANGWRYLMLAGEKESRFSVGPDYKVMAIIYTVRTGAETL